MKNFTPYRLVLLEGVADAFVDSLAQGTEFTKLMSKWAQPRVAPASISDKNVYVDTIRARLSELNETIANTLVEGEPVDGADAFAQPKDTFISGVLKKASRYSILKPYVDQALSIFSPSFNRLFALIPDFDLHKFTKNHGEPMLINTLGGYFNIFNGYNPQVFPRETIAHIVGNSTIKVQKHLLEGIQERVREDLDTFFNLYYIRNTKCTGFDPKLLELKFNSVVTGSYAVLDKSKRVVNGSLGRGRDYSVEYSYKYSGGNWLLSSLKMSILSIIAKPSYYC